MNHQLDTLTGSLILAAFSVLWIFLGWWWGRGHKDLAGTMLAGRRVGLALGAATALSTWITSNTTLVAPQVTLQLGIWGMVGYALGSVGLFLFAPLAQRIRELMPGGFTSGDFIRQRYGVLSWRVFLAISFVYSLGWLVSLGMAGGILIEALSGIPYAYGMTIMLLLCVTYTRLGGLRAVIGTDFIQVIVILVGLSALAWWTLHTVDLADIHARLVDHKPQLLNLWMPAAIMFLFNNLLFGIGEIFHSNVWWQRAFAFRKGVGRRAYTLAGLLWLPVPIVAGLIALTVVAFDVNVPAADYVGPQMAAVILGKAGAVVVFIVVFAALASSLDSLLAASSDLLAQDIYRGHINPQASDDQVANMARHLIVFLGVLTWVLCLLRVSTLGSLLYFTGALVASTIWPIIAGLYWRRANALAATAAMVLGTAAGLWAYFAIGFYVAALVSAFVSMVCVLAGRIVAPAHYEWQQLAQAQGARP